jgi:hypothetical protein
VTTFPQAASFFLTAAVAIRKASRRFGVVTNTTSTFRDDALIGRNTTPP